METTKQNLQNWLKQNPLLAYRKDTATTRAEIAAAVGVSENAVVKWEQGGMEPSHDNMDKLEKYTGERMGEQWRQWKMDKPQI